MSGRDLNMDGSYIGDDRMGLNTLDNSGYASYLDSGAITIYGPQAPGGMTMLEGTSIVKGSIYNPLGDIFANDQSAVYGRIAGNNVALRNDAAVFYDHALNAFTGYTNHDSQIYDDDETIRDEVLALASLDDGNLQSLADSLDMVVTRTLTSLVGDGFAASAHDVAEPAKPTPRPLEVTSEITSVGFNHAVIEGN